MRKHQKQEILNFIKNLDAAHEEIKEAIHNNNRILAQKMLSECQEFAIQLGGIIEKLEGEGHITISHVEEYCEALFHAYEELNNNVPNEDRIQRVLNKQFSEMENSINDDINVRIEAVFLPYKASMWDSLESVWKAADADPECDAYVIPIPYYDKNPDGSFKKVYYEGGEYPEYVPVTWYEDYDFESRRPDMIFIHNPYDSINYVTSVEPFFYSDNLKKYTEKLVYIPYFVLDDARLVNNQKEAAHFCTVPGVFHADKIIVQSETMRQVYINVLTEVTGKNSRSVWEKKILGIGSPKFDKVTGTQKEDLEIPEEWMQIIRRPDGHWKRIILYNTSVSALLEYNKNMLEKIQDVFCVFRKNRDNVTLLWRPHPLMEGTIKSMRPELWIEYQEIVRQYQKEGWGIYDDSSDLNRAIALSDAYYGDGSSVVQLCKKAGLPVMIQNIDSVY